MSGPKASCSAMLSEFLHENPRALIEMRSCESEADRSPILSAAPSIAPLSKRFSKPDPVFRDQLLSDRDVALRYRVEKQTIWRWVKTSSSFPKPFKVEGTTRWSENELDEHDRKLKEVRQ